MALSKLTDIRKSLSAELNNLNISGIATFAGNVSVGGTLTYEDVTNIDSVGIITAREGVFIPDNQKASFGTDDDGSIKHTGTNLQIFETTGNIQVTNYANDKDVDIKTDDGSGGTALYFRADGSTGESLLYHYGNEKIKTTNSGATVTGGINVSGSGLFGSANTSKNVDGCIIERNSGDGIVHISACRTGGNYSGFNFYVSGDQGGSGANAKLRHLIDYQGNFKWYDSDGSTERFKIQHDGIKIMSNGRLTMSSAFIDFSGNISTPQTGAAIFRPVADTLAVSLNNVERLRITTSKVQFNVDAKVDADNVRDLGASGARWRNLHLGTSARIGAIGTSANTAGDDLVIEGSSDRGISIISGSGSSANIYFGDSSDADIGRIAYQQTDNALDFQTNAGGTRLRIDSSGVVHLKSNTSAQNTTKELRFSPTTSATRYGSIQAVNNSGNNHIDLRFFTADADTPTEKVRITNDEKFITVGRHHLARKGQTPANYTQVKETLYQEVANGASYTFQTSSTYGGGTVIITSCRDSNATFMTTQMYLIGMRATANSGVSNTPFNTQGGASGGNSFTVAGASKGVTVTNNSGYTSDIFVTFDIQGFVA